MLLAEATGELTLRCYDNGRLEAKSIEQGKDLAKMEALLQVLQSAAPGEGHVRLVTAASDSPSVKQQELALRVVGSRVPQAAIAPVLSAGEGGRVDPRGGAGEEGNEDAKEARVAAGERRKSTEGSPYRQFPSTPPAVDARPNDREEGAGTGGTRDSRRRDVRTEWQVCARSRRVRSERNLEAVDDVGRGALRGTTLVPYATQTTGTSSRSLSLLRCALQLCTSSRGLS